MAGYIGKSQSVTQVDGYTRSEADAKHTGTQTFNRTSTDGDIVTLQKDGTAVGSIGVDSGDNIYFVGSGGGTGGFYIDGTQILPAAAGPTLTDDTYNLGRDVTRFKNLYLSGGVYLGGTGSANYLDDYEEGTFTPTVITNGFTQSISTISATYTKVGRLVTITYQVSLSSAGYASSYSRFGNLPFLAFSTQNVVSGYYGTGSISSNVIGNTNFVDASGAAVYLYPSTSTLNANTWVGSFTYIAA